MNAFVRKANENKNRRKVGYFLYLNKNHTSFSHFLSSMIMYLLINSELMLDIFN